MFDARLQLAALLVGVILAASTNTALAQGELSGFRTAVRNTDPPPPQPKKESNAKNRNHGHGRNCHCSQCCDDDVDAFDADLAALVGIVVGGAVTTPWWGPVLMLEDDYNVQGYFADNPYKAQVDGYMMIPPWLPEPPRTIAGRASIDYANSFDDLNNVTSKFLLETTSRWGIDSEITYRSEELNFGGKDELLTGDFNLIFRFAQSPHAQFRTGVGLNWLSDDIDDEFGVNFTYAFDLYPAKPWVLSSELDWGRLGDVHLIHIRSTVGYMIHSGELYFGVDHFDAGPLDMTTMITGVRVWF